MYTPPSNAAGLGFDVCQTDAAEDCGIMQAGSRPKSWISLHKGRLLLCGGHRRRHETTPPLPPYHDYHNQHRKQVTLGV